MLVLSRKPGQQIQIGNDVTVTIVKTQGKTVRVGINAPKEVKVLRSELPPHEEDRTSPRNHNTTLLTTSCDPRHRGDSSENISAKPQRSAQPARPHRWTVTAMRDRLPNSDRDSKGKPALQELGR